LRERKQLEMLSLKLKLRGRPELPQIKLNRRELDY
jgi:hypothetical protein